MFAGNDGVDCCDNARLVEIVSYMDSPYIEALETTLQDPQTFQQQLLLDNAANAGWGRRGSNQDRQSWLGPGEHGNPSGTEGGEAKRRGSCKC